MEAFREVLEANQAYVDSGVHTPLPVQPARQLVIITCMDSRIPAFPILGLNLGDAHILRTAGARVTDDVLRSLALSTHLLGTREVIVVGHTNCGLHDPAGTLEQRLTTRMTGTPVHRTWGAFSDPGEAIRADCQRLANWSDRPEGFEVAGLLLDVETGQLEIVVEPQSGAPGQRSDRR